MNVHGSRRIIMKTYKPALWVLLLVLLPNCFHVAEFVKIKFTNLKCEEFDRPFATFKKCFLKAVARDTVSLHIHVELHQIPVTNVTVNAQLFVKGNGYRPFLYNQTVDFCKFLINPNRYMFWKILYTNAKPYTNVNHTCPIDHDVIVDNMVLKAEMINLIPFPTNDYMIQLQFAAYNHYKAKVRVYVSIFD